MRAAALHDPQAMRERARLLQRSTWFAALEPPLKQEILRRSAVRHYAARTLVYAAGSAPGGFYVVLTGEVRLEHTSAGGKFAFYHSHREGALFGLLSEIDGSPRFSDARAWVDSTLMHLPRADCLDLYCHHPAAREAFVEMLCLQFRTTLSMLVESHSLPPRGQIANTLVALLERNDSGGALPAELPKLTQEALAAMAGLSRPTVAKVLHEFRSLGIIEMQYGSVKVRDSARLKQLAAQDVAEEPAARGPRR